MNRYAGFRDSRSMRSLGERAPGGRPGLGPSFYRQYVLRRLLLIPTQLLLVLVILYLALYEPVNLRSGQNLGLGGFFVGFSQMVVHDFTGNWGISTFEQYPGVPWSTLYGYLLPNSVELAVFSLGMASAIAYPVSLVTGWSRRRGVDVSSRLASLIGTFLPAMVVGSLVISATFFWFVDTFNGDLPDAGVIPTLPWVIARYGSIPSWLIYGSITRPTGLPLVDGVIQHAWAFELITLIKTLMQSSIIAIVYVTIFLRHARSVVFSASQETYLVGARSRAISERTLLWKHTARRVQPTFLLTFALTLPAYLGTQFAVEAAFLDRGIGFLILNSLTNQGGGGLLALQAMMFMLAVVILAWLFVVDLVAKRMDPRELTLS